VTNRPATAPAGKEEAARFLAKAEDFLETAQLAQERGLTNSSGAMAIHAGISACDALTAHFLGIRSNSGRHHDALDLVGRLPFEEKKALRRQLQRLLDAKHTVEYDDEAMIVGEEEEMVEAAKRIVEVARRRVKP
jgi:HEPN domain-containing protein